MDARDLTDEQRKQLVAGLVRQSEHFRKLLARMHARGRYANSPSRHASEAAHQATQAAINSILLESQQPPASKSPPPTWIQARPGG